MIRRGQGDEQEVNKELKRGGKGIVDKVFFCQEMKLV